MNLILEIFYFILLTLIIVAISKYVLVSLLRKLAETLNLKPKSVGIIAGAATSIPELLTVCFSAISGFMTTSITNILSSNIINTVLYAFSVIFNKNGYMLKNRALKIDLILVFFTILIPTTLVIFNVDFNIGIVPIFILLFILFYYINGNAHKLYLQHEEKAIYEKIEEEERWLRGKHKRMFFYIASLAATGILLFFVGNSLSNVLETLCLEFNLPEWLIGIALGVTTSIPEMITFFESQKHYKKKESNEGVIEATNNLLSSNMLNLFIIQSIGIIIFTLLF